MTVLPDRYILDKWRKDIKRKYTYVSTCIDDVQHNPVLERNEKLHRLAVGVLEIGAESVENFNVLEKLLIDLKDNFPRSCDKQPLSQRKNSVGAASDVVKTEVVRSPMVVKRKGRPRTKRHQWRKWFQNRRRKGTLPLLGILLNLHQLLGYIIKRPHFF